METKFVKSMRFTLLSFTGRGGGGEDEGGVYSTTDQAFRLVYQVT